MRRQRSSGTWPVPTLRNGRSDNWRNVRRSILTPYAHTHTCDVSFVYPHILSRGHRLSGRCGCSAGAKFYELLWQRDLGKYRLYMQGAAEDTFPALPIEFLGTGSDENGPYIEARLQRGSPPDFYRCAIIIGTPFVGVRRYSVSFRESPAGGGVLRLYCDLQGLPLPNTGILWPAVEEGLMLEPSFDFLIRNVQNDLFWLQRIGTSDVQRRQQDSALQLLDAIFGANPLLETSR